MATKVYGASDDLIEVEGDLRGEAGHAAESSALVFLSDGTIIEMKYGKADSAIWGIQPLIQGNLFEKIELCFDEDADPHSDVLFLKDGIKWGYVVTEWERIK